MKQFFIRAACLSCACALILSSLFLSDHKTQNTPPSEIQLIPIQDPGIDEEALASVSVNNTVVVACIEEEPGCEAEKTNKESEEKKERSKKTSADKVYHFSSAEKKMLKRIAMAEAGNQGVKGQALIMRVVLNRVESSRFPDSIEGVIFQKGQFSSVAGNDSPYYSLTPNEDSDAALKLIEDGWDKSQKALYFESCDGQSWQSRNLRLLYTHKDHRFYR